MCCSYLAATSLPDENRGGVVDAAGGQRSLSDLGLLRGFRGSALSFLHTFFVPSSPDYLLTTALLARVKIEEKQPMKPRHEVQDVVLPLTEQPLQQKDKV